MKYLLLLALLAGLFFFLGAKRGRPREPEAQPPPPPSPPATPKTMLRCAQCGMHLPAEDALPGRGGVFCSPEHRASFETRPGGPA
ncbi:PP0621 family protein [Roseateles sp.]|uniref:PP0621 family protein n=1 Tax=Roseateles sp. TaxID=1971397 RepID=UPI003BA878FD